MTSREGQFHPGAFYSQLGKTLQIVRKVSKVNQVEMGRVLGVHQAAISRIENGSQSLTTDQLYLVTQYFGLRPDDVLSGEIDFWSLAERFSQPPPFPEKYRKLAFTRVREVLPFLKYLETSAGALFAAHLLGDLRVNPAVIRAPDQNIGTAFELDLIRTLIQKKMVKASNLDDVARLSRSPGIQGFMHAVYQNQKTQAGIIQTWLLNTDLYENNFSYQTEESSLNKIVISVEPREHMKDLPYKDETLGDFLCQYRKRYLRELALYHQSSPLEVEESECSFHGSHRCIYKLKMAI